MEPLFLYLLTMLAAGFCTAKGCVFVKNNHMRVILCLFMCCVFLFTSVALPAYAVGVDWILHQVSTDIGVTAILEGLGIFRDAASDYFGELVDDVSDALTTTGQASLGFINAYYKVNPLGTTSPFFAFPLSLIEFVRNWVFDNGVVYSPSTSFSCSISGYGSGVVSAPYDFVFFTFYSLGNFYLAGVCSKSCYATINFESGATQSYYFNSEYRSLYYFSTSFGTSRLSTSFPDYGNYSSAPSSVVKSIIDSNFSSGFSVLTDKPLVLGSIIPPDTMFASAYPLWLEHEYTLADGTMETVVQIGLGNTQAETESLTQEQIWAGQGTLQIPGQDQNQGTLLDILQSIVQLPTQIVGSIQTALQSFFQITGETTDYAIQLRDFFPFCIPFDLFDFITVLSADPEAPVFHWEIPVPQLGQTFELEVDLSAWDDIAVLFRNLELLAFIFGLAIMTREKFLRS